MEGGGEQPGRQTETDRQTDRQTDREICLLKVEFDLPDSRTNALCRLFR